jgi:large subunit ribosomal protein L6
MSKIGRKPITIPEGVEVKIEGSTFSAKGPKGALSLEINPEIKVEVKDKELIVSKVGTSRDVSAFWGLMRALINNIIVGVKEGFEKRLELQGVGFRMAIQGKKINLALGFSHPVVVDIPEGIEAKIEEKTNTLVISGIDRQKVGQFAANVRMLKKVEPYKGKGFRYSDEKVRRKVGKKAAATTAK